MKALRYFFLLHLSFLFMACGSETDSEPASNDQAMVNPEEVSDNIPSYPIEDFMNSIFVEKVIYCWNASSNCYFANI